MSGSRDQTTDRRGQSSVIAVVLLVAIVSISATGVALVGTESITRTKDTVENERVENGFRALDKNLDTVARTEGGSRSVDLAIDGTRGAVRQENTGRIVVTTDNRSTPIVNRTVGSITYTTNDGEKFAYQAGGVFSGTGRQSQVVSNPDLSYRDETLTLPIVITGGDERLTDNRVSISKNITPLRSDIQLLENEFLTMRITSEYYMGWANYFESQTNAAAISIDHANETVTVKLGRAEADGDFDNGVTASGNVAKGNGNAADISGPISATGSIDSGLLDGDDQGGVSNMPSEIDSVIDRKIEYAENGSNPVTVVSEDLSGVSTLQGGNTYYAPDGITLNDSSEGAVADLSTGNVTLIVDGDIVIKDGEIHAKNGAGNKALRTYTSGDLAMKNGEFCAGTCGGTSARYNQVYGTSVMQVAMKGGNTFFKGTIYAPRDNEANGENTADLALDGKDNNKCDKSASDDYDICITTGNSGVYGSITAGSTKVGQSTEVTYDTTLQDVDPVLALNGELLPPDLTYVHVTVYKVDVNSED